jgi:NitT/TauT family transport system permease protein
MICRPIPRRVATLLSVLSVVALLMGYDRLSLRQHRRNPEDTTIPTWSQLNAGVHCLVKERWIVEDSKATGFRLFLGLSIGIAGAIVLGLMMGCLTPVEALLAPPLSLLAKVPPTAALAVFFVLAGTGTPMYVTMIAFGVLPSLAQSVYLACRDVRIEFLYKAYTLGASEAEVVWNVVVRMILPKLMDSIRLQIGPAVVYLIAAEMVCADIGFGYRIRMQMRLLNMNVVYPYLVFLAAFGFAMDTGLKRLQRVCCPWAAGEGR